MTLDSTKYQNSRKIPNFILKNIEKQMLFCKITAKEVHLNGHTIGFCQQTQTLEQHYTTESGGDRIKNISNNNQSLTRTQTQTICNNQERSLHTFIKSPAFTLAAETTLILN